jgi:hypothetical protein
MHYFFYPVSEERPCESHTGASKFSKVRVGWGVRGHLHQLHGQIRLKKVVTGQRSISWWVKREAIVGELELQRIQQNETL